MPKNMSYTTRIAVFCILPATPVYAGHPLLTEDTGTQGHGNAQVELLFERSQLDEPGIREVSRDTSLVLSYGLADPFDLILTIPHTRVESSGSPTVSGIGDVELAAKWRFYQQGALSFALRPGFTFTTGDENEGLGSGKRTTSLFTIMSYDAAPWALHLHAGITNNRNVLGEREHITHLSVGGSYNVTDKLKVVGDISHETNTDITSGDDIESAVVGIIYAVSDRVDLDMGYRAGITDSAADETWLLGVTMHF